MKRPEISGLYYITHIDNVPSIIMRGILSHERIEAENVQYTSIYNEEIVANRHQIQTPDGHSLWHFANLYFWPRNPMLYRVLCQKPAHEIAIISVQPSVIDRLDIFISTGNAAHSHSEILTSGEGLKRLRQIIKDTIRVEYWRESDGTKRKIMAECLVPDIVTPDQIQAIYVSTHRAKGKLEASIPHSNLAVIPESNMFFLPAWRRALTPKLSLVEGDMFFSRMQTFTISVNTVGIMGKGLASRAKYQFPDVYVHYQDFCRSRRLKMGKPQLYKRESSLDHELADDPESLSNCNLQRWFLMFPTKENWRERANINGIEEGLRWLKDNYKKEGIESLAIPALGCGLGGLEWCDVGPLMCRYLKTFDIQIAIYLPAEREVDKELLTKEFLLA